MQGSGDPFRSAFCLVSGNVMQLLKVYYYTISRVEADGNGEVSGSGEWDAGF